MSKRNRAYLITELNNRAEQFRSTQEKRIHGFRRRHHSDKDKRSTKTDSWDLPLTVCSCGSLKPPYIATNGRNCSALKNPHSVLQKAYNNIIDDNGRVIGSIPLGQKPNNFIRNSINLTQQDSWPAGRCAEPHAANRLLNVVTRQSVDISMADIQFSVAYDSRYPIAKPYCVTCRCAFPQIRHK